MNLIVRADADSRIGTGHLMRCFALAQAWQDRGGKVSLLSRCESDLLQGRLIEEGINLIPLEKSYPDPGDLERTIEVIREVSTKNSLHETWLVIDGYHFDAFYQEQIKKAGCKLLWLDDYGHADHYYADLILNQNISANESFYLHRESYTQLLLGVDYTLLRREFKKWRGWQRTIPAVARKVLVTMGGSDPDNITQRVIQALKYIDMTNLETKILVGPANPHQAALEREIADRSNFELIKKASNIPELIAWADIAITAGGSTCWELSFMGTPFLTVVIAENQRQTSYHLHTADMSRLIDFQRDIHGADAARPLKSVIEDAVLRRRWSQKISAMVDGKGTDRVIEAMGRN